MKCPILKDVLLSLCRAISYPVVTLRNDFVEWRLWSCCRVYVLAVVALYLDHSFWLRASKLADSTSSVTSLNFYGRCMLVFLFSVAVSTIVSLNLSGGLFSLQFIYANAIIISLPVIFNSFICLMSCKNWLDLRIMHRYLKARELKRSVGRNLSASL